MRKKSINMKIPIVFKMTDAAVYQALQDVPENQKDYAEEVIHRFIRWGEYVTIEVDTETKTAIVVPV